MEKAPPELLVFALADHAFREADALADHLIKLKAADDSHLYGACTTGIVTAYCRPFLSSYGLGKLPTAMGVFHEKEFQVLHDTVVETRHKLAAHFDRNHSEERFKSGTLRLPPSEVTVHLEMTGFAATSNTAYLNPELLDGIRRLCEYQLKRVSAHLGAFAVKLIAREKRTGEFVFVID